MANAGIDSELADAPTTTRGSKPRGFFLTKIDSELLRPKRSPSGTHRTPSTSDTFIGPKSLCTCEGVPMLAQPMPTETSPQHGLVGELNDMLSIIADHSELV